MASSVPSVKWEGKECHFPCWAPVSWTQENQITFFIFAIGLLPGMGIWSIVPKSWFPWWQIGLGILCITSITGSNLKPFACRLNGYHTSCADGKLVLKEAARRNQCVHTDLQVKSAYFCLSGALHHLGHIGTPISSQSPSWIHGTNAKMLHKAATACESAKAVFFLAARWKFRGWQRIIWKQSLLLGSFSIFSIIPMAPKTCIVAALGCLKHFWTYKSAVSATEKAFFPLTAFPLTKPNISLEQIPADNI